MSEAMSIKNLSTEAIGSWLSSLQKNVYDDYKQLK